MTFSVEVDLGGIKFSATEDTVEALLKQYEQMKGDSGWLLRKVQETIPLAEAGQATMVVTHHPDLDAAENTQGGIDAWAQDGPWNATGSTQSAQKVDPWDNTPVADNRPSQTRSAPQRQSAQPSGGSGAQTETDRFGREWTTGLPDAPACKHGDPAARLKAKSQKGKPYTVWACAKGAPSGDYRNKCDFWEYPN
jgi:hypothetical protein